MKYCIIILFLGPIIAQDIDLLFEYGNQSFINGRFDDAIDIYEKILEQDQENADLYYNLGNAYFRSHEIGRAIWAYNKGIKLSPRDNDIHQNLEIANSRIIDRLVLPEPFFLLRLYRDLKNNFTIQEFIMIGSLLLFLEASLFMNLQFGWIGNIMIRKCISILVISAMLIHGIALDKFFQKKNPRQGIIIENGVEAYSGPFYGENTVLFRINEGTLVDLDQSQEGWVEIILIDGKTGWITINTMRAL